MTRDSLWSTPHPRPTTQSTEPPPATRFADVGFAAGVLTVRRRSVTVIVRPRFCSPSPTVGASIWRVNLPNADDALVEQSKIADYLLAFDHPEGASKAEFFSSFGFTAGDWQDLAYALVEHARAHPVSSMMKSSYGTKYGIDGPIHCPDGRTPSIRAVWIIDAGGQNPRLVTAHPL